MRYVHELDGEESASFGPVIAQCAAALKGRRERSRSTCTQPATRQTPREIERMGLDELLAERKVGPGRTGRAHLSSGRVSITGRSPGISELYSHPSSAASAAGADQGTFESNQVS